MPSEKIVKIYFFEKKFSCLAMKKSDKQIDPRKALGGGETVQTVGS